MPTKKNEVATQEQTAALAEYTSPEEGFSLAQIMEEDMSGLGFTITRLKIPSGGITAFEVPGDGDEPEVMKEIEGVIVYNHPAYTYYATAFTGENNPPDCSSIDGQNGTGNPGGKCKACPMHKWGSGENGNPACAQRRMLYFLPKGSVISMALSLPVGSIGTYRDYASRLLTKMRSVRDVVTAISLRKSQSKGGVTYSQAVFKYVRDLSPTEKSFISDVTAFAKQYADQRGLDELDETAVVDSSGFTQEENDMFSQDKALQAPATDDSGFMDIPDEDVPFM